MRHSKSTRSVSIAIVSIAMLGGSCLIPLAAQASEHPVQVAADVDPSPALPEVKKHDASAFSGEAAQLPKGLKDAIKRDLKKSPEEYLAEAESAKDASDLQVELAKRGVQVTHSELVDGKLKLRVATEEQAKLARKSGADVTVGPADPPKPAIAAKALASNNGTGWAHFAAGNSEGEACSIGFYGYDKSDGQQQFLTVGHCDPGANPISRIDQPRAGQLDSATLVATSSTPVAGTFQFGGGRDAGLIKPDLAKFSATDVVETWEGNRTGRPSITSMRLRGAVVATVGAPLCKSGITTGWSCGAVEQVNVAVSFDAANTILVNSIISSACGDHGDSGGANLIGQYAVGITSGGGDPCGGGDPFLSSYPLLSVDPNFSNAMSVFDWEPRIAMYPPVVAAGGSGTVPGGATMNGSVYGGDENYRLDVYWDGASTPTQTVALAPDGSFVVSVPTTAGNHSYVMASRWGTRNFSNVVGGSLTVSGPASLVKTAASSSVYLVVDGGKYPISGMDLLSALSPLGPLTIVSQAYIDGLVLRQGATRILRGPDGAMYFADGGQRLRFRDCALVANWGGSCYGNGFTPLTADQMSRFPIANQWMASIATQPDGSQYWVTNHTRREILDEGSRVAGGAPSDRVALSSVALSHLALADPLVRDSVFVSDRASGAQWLIAGSKKSSISSTVSVNVGVSACVVGRLSTASLDRITTAGAFNGVIRGSGDSSASILTRDGRWLWVDAGGSSVPYTPVSQQLANAFSLVGTVRPGDMIKAPSNGTVFMVMSDKILPIGSWGTMVALAGGSTPVIGSVSDTFVATVPLGPVALELGTMARTNGNATVYLVNGVTNKIAFSKFDYPMSFGFSQFSFTSDERLAAYPLAGQLLEFGVSCGGTNYVGAGGSAHRLGSTTQQLYPFVYVPLDEFTCRIMPKGVDANEFIRTPDGSIYQLVNGQKRPIGSIVRWQQVSGGKTPLDVNPLFAAKIPTGPAA